MHLSLFNHRRTFGLSAVRGSLVVSLYPLFLCWHFLFSFVLREFVIFCWSIFMTNTLKLMPGHFILLWASADGLFSFKLWFSLFLVWWVVSLLYLVCFGHYLRTLLRHEYIFYWNSQSLCLGLMRGSWLNFRNCSSNENVIFKVFSVLLVYLV